ncbi:hypothetical protein SteCoe_26155 [Stentor coeruleus]|uniref:Uncharacterized protein n=1 Tax=Stentor coeruleus TaxID=5963 RepID=A0A1R2BDK4_9CILI|nr:hypothetical protein SteCoe_26155 [Stentor coeruleus]
MIGTTLETYVFVEDLCRKVFFNDRNYSVDFQATRIGKVNSILLKILKEHITAANISDKILCYVINGKGRLSLSAKGIKEILDGSKKLNHVSLVQKLKPNISNHSSFYSMELILEGFKYKAEFIECILGEYKESNNLNLAEFIECILGEYKESNNLNLGIQAREIALLLLPILEKSQKAIIERIVFEFSKDQQEKLWLRFVKILKSSIENCSRLSKIESYIIEKQAISLENTEDFRGIITSNTKHSVMINRSKSSLQNKLFRANTFGELPIINRNEFIKKSQLYEELGHNTEDEDEDEISEYSIDDEEESNFLEILAREKVKQSQIDLGKSGRITPDNEILLKEMKILKRSLDVMKLPNLKTHVVSPRNTMQAVPSNVKLAPILRRSNTKLF